MGKTACTTEAGNQGLTVAFPPGTELDLDDRLLGVIDKLESGEITPAAGNSIARITHEFVDIQRLKHKYGRLCPVRRVGTAEVIPDPKAQNLQELERQLAQLKAAG